MLQAFVRASLKTFTLLNCGFSHIWLQETFHSKKVPFVVSESGKSSGQKLAANVHPNLVQSNLFVYTMKQTFSWSSCANWAFRTLPLVGWKVTAWPQLVVHFQNKSFGSTFPHELSDVTFCRKVQLTEISSDTVGRGRGHFASAAQRTGADSSRQRSGEERLLLILL